MSSFPQRHDVAVLGGGLIGLSVAWRAAARGLDVVLVERGDLGRGASHVAAGMLAPVAEADPGERELLELGLAAAARWPGFAEELGAAAGRDVGLREQGTLLVARDRDEAEALEREVVLRESFGLAVERLLPSDARRREPALATTVRAAALFGADHAVDPRRVANALQIACARAGVEFRIAAEVTAVVPGEGVEVDPGGFVGAAEVVVATGAWSDGLPGVPSVPVRPVKGQTVRLTGPPLLERTVRYEGGYLVPRQDGELVLGATMEEQGFDTAMTAGGLYELLRDASEVVPGVLELEVTETLAGLRPGTPDNRPLLGRFGGVVWATGHHRNGVLLTPVTADLIADLLTGEDRVPAAFSPARFDRAGIAAS